jgi:5-methylcytosine-specific restriction endonuclease McrA
MAKGLSRKGIVRKLDKLVGDIVKLRDGQCVVCGSKSNLTSGHLFSRVAYSTRWDLDNLFCQCLSCNLRHEYDPYPLMKYAERVWGREKVEEIHKKYVTPHKFRTFQLIELYEDLNKYLTSGSYSL